MVLVVLISYMVNFIRLEIGRVDEEDKKICLLIMLSFSFTACGGADGVENVGANDFIKKIKEPGVIVVDVRSEEEFRDGHLQGAINIDVNSPSFEKMIAGLDKTITYAIYCRSGNRSTIAYEKMLNAGFTNLINFNKGGFAELSNLKL